MYHRHVSGTAAESLVEADAIAAWKAAGHPVGNRTDLVARLHSAVATGQRAWPELAVSSLDFIEVLAGVCRQQSDLDRLHVGDLFLATAARHGVPGAVESFRAYCANSILAALARFPSEQGFQDEVMQLLLERLFVARLSAAPAITKYTGRGSLPRWTQAVAVRVAIDRLRGRGRLEDPTSDAKILDQIDKGNDPEFRYLEAHYRAAFKTAFESAVEQLPAASKRILREHFVFGLSTRQLAKLHGVHKATAARRLSAARDSLIAAVRSAIAEQLSMSEHELRSVLRLVASHLHVSLARVLGED